MKDRVNKFFESSKDVDFLYSTSDGFLFTQKQDAIAHSLTLDNKEVSELKRDESRDIENVKLGVEPKSLETEEYNQKNKKNGTTKGKI